MSVDKVAGEVVHFPKRRDVFQFDEEVSRIFPDMAMRSIPMYREAHRLHVEILRDIFIGSPEVVVCDIGASRGHFFKEVCNQLQIPEAEGSDRFKFIAVDKSLSMLDALRAEMPWVTAVEADAVNMADLEKPADIICLFYILQFIRSDSDKLSVLQWANRNLKKGGTLLLGQKEETSITYKPLFDEVYYKFRMDNGYSLEEIQAKTKALSNSMWPSSPAWLEDMCYRAGFIDYVETTRWLQFSTSMCTK